MRAVDSAWRELVDQLLHSAEERPGVPGGYKKMPEVACLAAL